MTKTSVKIRKLALAAILTAIILLMSFTPLGYLRVEPVSITFLTIPVAIGGMVLGSVWGGFLGAVFGATSFAQCFMGDLFGTALVSINPMYTALCCFVPRILIGLVAGILFPVFRRVSTSAIAFVNTAVAGILTNTVLFVGMVVAFFKNTYFGGGAFLTIFVGFFSINVVLELIIGIIVSAALSAVLDRFVSAKI